MKNMVALEIANAGRMHGLDVSYIAPEGDDGAALKCKSPGAFVAAVAHAILNVRGVRRSDEGFRASEPGKLERAKMRKEIIEGLKDICICYLQEEGKETFSFYIE